MSAQIRHILDDANMDDEDIMRIMSIVKKQEEENEKLKKNYRNPVEQWLGATDLDGDYIQKCIDDEVDENDILKKENEKLKEENEELKERVSEWKKVMGEYADHDDPWPSLVGEWICDQTNEFEEDIEKLQERVDEMEEENEKLKEKLNSIQGEIKDVLKEEEKLCEKDDY